MDVKTHVAQILHKTQIGTRQKTSMTAQRNAALNTTMIFKTHLWGFGVPCHISLWIQTVSENLRRYLTLQIIPNYIPNTS